MLFLSEFFELTPNLFISAATAVTEEKIRAAGIGLVVNAARELPLVSFGEGVDVLKVPVRDEASEDLKSHFPTVCAMLEEARLNDVKCLVHCVAGISRSAALCAAYLIRYEAMTSDEAVQHVRVRRKGARPNAGFLTQLAEWHEECQWTDAESASKTEIRSIL